MSCEPLDDFLVSYVKCRVFFIGYGGGYAGPVSGGRTIGGGGGGGYAGGGGYTGGRGYAVGGGYSGGESLFYH